MSDIILCPVCKGEGECEQDVGTHHSEYEYYSCSKCNSTGRVHSTTVSYTFIVPFGYPLKDYYKINTEAHDAMRNFVKSLDEATLNHMKDLRNLNEGEK